jgi:2-polyprenyl-6-methoxyphenol hydroxylase-like FAD-dependent oxidoreductase
MSLTNRVDVVIVGAGPVGLLAGCELRRRGITVRIIDKLPRPTDQSRAIIVHARSLEMLARMGLAEQVINAGIKSVAMQLLDGSQPLARVELGDVDSVFPYSVTIAQTDTERILAHRLHDVGGAVERGVELVGLTQDEEQVTLTCKHFDDTIESISARWVIGSDGGRSSVRELVGGHLDGSFEGERFVLGDVEAEHDLDTHTMYTYFSPDGPLLAFPMGGNRMRIMAQHRNPAGRPNDPPPTQEELQGLVHARGGAITIIRSHWLTEFEIHHAQVPKYRYGRVFLAGDAAHVHSPAGGQGMNTGMQDAFNLAWKLARTIRGDGGERLLNSYNAERHPVAAQVIKLSTRLTELGTVRGDVAIAVRNHAFRAAAALAPIRHVIATDLEEINIAYRGSPIVVGRHQRHHHVRPGDALPPLGNTDVQDKLSHALNNAPEHALVTIATGRAAPGPAHVACHQILVADQASGAAGYDAIIVDDGNAVARRLGLRHDTRVVIRPDGYIGCIADIDDADTVGRYFAHLRG